MDYSHDIGALEIRVPFDIDMRWSDIDGYVVGFVAEFGCVAARVLDYSSDGVVGPGRSIQWPLVRFEGRLDSLVAIRTRFDIRGGVGQ